MSDEVRRREAQEDLDARHLAVAGSCWHWHQFRDSYRVEQFIRDIELFVGGPVHKEQVQAMWVRVLGVKGVIEGLTAHTQAELKKEVDYANWDNRADWNVLSHAWTYAVSSRKRAFLLEESTNCWVRWTGSSFDRALWYTNWSRYEAMRDTVPLKPSFFRSFREHLHSDWREFFTLPGGGLSGEAESSGDGE